MVLPFGCCSGGKCASNKPDLTRHASHPSCTKFFGCLPSLGDVLAHQQHSTQHGKQILPLTDTQGSLGLGGCIDQADCWIVIWKIVFTTCPANGDSPGCEANRAERAYIPCLGCIVVQCCSTDSFVVAEHCSSWVCFLHSASQLLTLMHFKNAHITSNCGCLWRIWGCISTSWYLRSIRMLIV
jgi:hypothetical protein